MMILGSLSVIDGVEFLLIGICLGAGYKLFRGGSYLHKRISALERAEANRLNGEGRVQ